MKRKSVVIYEHYEYLAKKYARQIFAYEELSFEFEDLLQEFRLKIFTSIQAYGRRWAAYRRGEKPRPVPIRYYLECACANKKHDFVKYISRENYKVRIDSDAFKIDFGYLDETQFSESECKYILNGVDLLEGLTGRERCVFILFLRGYKKKELNKVYFGTKDDKAKKKAVQEDGDEPFDAMDVVSLQQDYLIKKYGTELFSNVKVYQIRKQD